LATQRLQEDSRGRSCCRASARSQCVLRSSMRVRSTRCTPPLLACTHAHTHLLPKDVRHARRIALQTGTHARTHSLTHVGTTCTQDLHTRTLSTSPSMPLCCAVDCAVAVLSAAGKTQGCSAYVVKFPTCEGAKVLAGAGVKSIYYLQSVCVCVCVCARARAHARGCVCGCVFTPDRAVTLHERVFTPQRARVPFKLFHRPSFFLFPSRFCSAALLAIAFSADCERVLRGAGGHRHKGCATNS
jgi:hypothetical protein